MISATLKKLRYQSGMRVAVLGAPTAFEVELKKNTQISRAHRLEKDLDLIQAFFTLKVHLEKDLRRFKASLTDKGILWLCYPKAKALGTDLNRDIVRVTAATVGLEGVSIVAIDAVWSALRCKVTR